MQPLTAASESRFDAAKPDEPPQLFRDTALRSADFRAADFQTRQVFVRSRDGTRVPMFIVSRKGIQLTGSNPTLLYGYGGASCLASVIMVFSTCTNGLQKRVCDQPHKSLMTSSCDMFHSYM